MERVLTKLFWKKVLSVQNENAIIPFEKVEIKPIGMEFLCFTISTDRHSTSFKTVRDVKPSSKQTTTIFHRLALVRVRAILNRAKKGTNWVKSVHFWNFGSYQTLP